MKKLMKIFKREDGQSLVEYALIIALVAIALTVGLTALSSDLSATFDSIAASL